VTATTFSEARREAIRLLIGLAGGTGSGKTYSALRLATGLAGDARFALIDTENGRALHYADEFAFDHGPLEPPFTPERYLAAILAADAAGYPVIVVDSASHEYAGEGGVLDMQEAEFARMGGRDSAKMASWIEPKRAHKKLARELIRLRAHLILCFRAEPKIEMVKDERGKWQIVPKPSLTGLDGWVPIAEKNLPYELTVSLLLTADAPGVPKPIKLPDRLRALVPLDIPLNERDGQSLGEWASGDRSPGNPSPGDTPNAAAVPLPSGGDGRRSPGTAVADLLTPDQSRALDAIVGPLRREGKITTEQLWHALGEDRARDWTELVLELGGVDEADVLHWSPLRDALTKSEASSWIDRLSKYAQAVTVGDAPETGGS